MVFKGDTRSLDCSTCKDFCVRGLESLGFPD